MPDRRSQQHPCLEPAGKPESLGPAGARVNAAPSSAQRSGPPLAGARALPYTHAGRARRVPASEAPASRRRPDAERCDVDDYPVPGYEDEPPPSERRERGSRLPGGISVQTAAAILLVAVLLALLYLFFGPVPEAEIDVAEAPTSEATTAPSDDAEAEGDAAGEDGATAAPSEPAQAAADAPQSGPTTEGAPSAPTEAQTSATAVAPTLAAAGAPTAQGEGESSFPIATTPPALSMDGFAQVSGTGSLGIRLRFGAGLDTATIRIVDEGEVFKVIGAPLDEAGETWWRLQDRLGNVGWASGEFLVPIAAPPGWNPPVASPTFEADLDALDGAGDAGDGAATEAGAAP